MICLFGANESVSQYTPGKERNGRHGVTNELTDRPIYCQRWPPSGSSAQAFIQLWITLSSAASSLRLLFGKGEARSAGGCVVVNDTATFVGDASTGTEGKGGTLPT